MSSNPPPLPANARKKNIGCFRGFLILAGALLSLFVLLGAVVSYSARGGDGNEKHRSADLNLEGRPVEQTAAVEANRQAARARDAEVKQAAAEQEAVAAARAERIAKVRSMEDDLSKILPDLRAGKLISVDAVPSLVNEEMITVECAFLFDPSINVFDAVDLMRKHAVLTAKAVFSSSYPTDRLTVAYKVDSDDGLGNKERHLFTTLEINREMSDKVNWDNAADIEPRKAFVSHAGNELIKILWENPISPAEFSRWEERAKRQGIPVAAYISLHSSALEEWPSNPEMQKHVLEQSIKAWKAMNR